MGTWTWCHSAEGSGNSCSHFGLTGGVNCNTCHLQAEQVFKSKGDATMVTVLEQRVGLTTSARQQSSKIIRVATEDFTTFPPILLYQELSLHFSHSVSCGRQAVMYAPHSRHKQQRQMSTLKIQHKINRKKRFLFYVNLEQMGLLIVLDIKNWEDKWGKVIQHWNITISYFIF